MEHVISGFELLEASMSGVGHHEHVAYIANERQAQMWVNESPSFRKFQPYKKTIVIHEDLASLKAFQREQLKQKALVKLSPEERSALGF